MDLYDIAIARKLSGGGGGGSSDFSTAEVTITCSSDFYMPLALVVEDYDGPIIVPYNETDVEAETVIVAISTNGQQTTFYPTDNSSVAVPTVAVTGHIENIDGDIIITGDGTITIS